MPVGFSFYQYVSPPPPWDSGLVAIKCQPLSAEINCPEEICIHRNLLHKFFRTGHYAILDQKPRCFLSFQRIFRVQSGTEGGRATQAKILEGMMASQNQGFLQASGVRRASPGGDWTDVPSPTQPRVLSTSSRLPPKSGRVCVRWSYRQLPLWGQTVARRCLGMGALQGSR